MKVISQNEDILHKFSHENETYENRFQLFPNIRNLNMVYSLGKKYISYCDRLKLFLLYFKKIYETIKYF